MSAGISRAIIFWKSVLMIGKYWGVNSGERVDSILRDF
jgi:hypothetical protein